MKKTLTIFMLFVLFFSQLFVGNVLGMKDQEGKPDLILLENVPEIEPTIHNKNVKLTALNVYEKGNFTKVSEGLSWNSSNKNVATVDDNGLVTFTGQNGRTFVTVSNGTKEDRIALDYKVAKQSAEKGKPNSVASVEKQTGIKYDIITHALENLSLEEKVGQMMMPDFRKFGGSDVTEMLPEIEQMVKDYHLGGVILFRENVVDTEQTARLVNNYQEASDKFGLLITIDQEGGIVTRLQSGTHMPGNMALGASRSTDLAWKTGDVIGSELASLGINMNLAPVVDVNNNPDNPVIGVRSFSENPQLVAELGVAYTKGMQSNGVAGTAKHFPGHGDTSVDSHLGLPEVPHNKDRLLEVELYPFQKLMEQGIDAIMTAHVTFPKIDSNKAISQKTGEEVFVPATLSYNVLTELMRNEMGFDGVVMTDAMNMKAIADHFGPVDASIRAINAGADIILMPVGVSEVFNGIVNAVNAGDITDARIDESVGRILTLKVKRGIIKEETPVDIDKKVQQALQVVGSLDHQAVEAEVAAKSVTVVKNENNLLPLKPDTDEKVVVVGAFSFIDSFYAQVKARHENTVLLKLKSGQSSLDEDQKQTLTEADIIIIGSYTSSVYGRSPSHPFMQTYNEVANLDKPTVAVSFRNPYDIMAYQNVDAYVAQYGYREASHKATADVLFGIESPTGKLPVTIPSYQGGTLYEFGTGIEY